jgi:hypothetical protein
MKDSMRWHRDHEGATLYSVLDASRAWRFAAEDANYVAGLIDWRPMGNNQFWAADDGLAYMSWPPVAARASRGQLGQL